MISARDHNRQRRQQTDMIASKRNDIRNRQRIQQTNMIEIEPMTETIILHTKSHETSGK